MWERRGAGGRGSHLCGAGAAAVATHSPRALLGAGGSAASGRASKRWEPGSAEGAPGRCLRSGRSSPRSSGAEEELEANEESTSGAGRARGGGASPTPPPPVQARERSLTAPPAQSPSPRSPLPQGWSKSLRGARCSAPLPGSPPPTDRSRLRAPPAQAGEVSCARRLAREPAAGQRQRSAGTMDWGWGSRCCRPGRRDLLCVLALLAGCLLPVCRTRVYTNHWAVKIAGGFAEADRIASKYGFINVGQVTNPRWHRLCTQKLVVWGTSCPLRSDPSPFSRCALQLRARTPGRCSRQRAPCTVTHMPRSCWDPCLICFYKR